MHRGPVGVTGATTGLGAALLERLARRADPPDLVALGSDPPMVPQMAGLTTVVHLATSYDVQAEPAARRALNTAGTAALLAAAREAGVRRVVLTTSAAVLRCRPGDALPLRDSTPLRSGQDDGLLGDHLEMERLAGHAVRSGLPVTVLRPASLSGGALDPSYDGALLRQLASPRLLALRGIEPRWQLCHVEDLLSALELAATGALTTSAAVACPGSLSQREVEQLAGRRRVELPASVATATAERLHRLGITPASPRELDALLAPLVVAADRLTAAGWTASWTNEEVLRDHLARPSAGPEGSRAGAYSAAGATVAVLGTAALVRRARRRRGR